MNDATTTLRALADACEECDRIAEDDDIAFPRWASDQRAALMRALPAVEGWPDTAAALRTMADTVDALESERDALRAEVAALKTASKPADPIPGVPPLNSIPVMLSEHMEPGAMLLVCGSTAFARIKAGVSDV